MVNFFFWGGLSSPEDGLLAAGAHTDYGMLTFLATDDVPGLEVYMPEQGWISIPPLKGAFVTNLGDMMQRWTNDCFR